MLHKPWKKKLEGHRALSQALFEAAGNGHVDVVRAILKKAKELGETYEEDGETLLIHAINTKQSAVSE